MVAELSELRLTRFKSVQDARIVIGSLTLLVGRNGSGKSNVLDSLAVLSSLASGANLRDALDGGRDGPVVRGGSAGCAPLGEDSFAIGCTARLDEMDLHLDLEIQTSPTLQIRSERLWSARLSGPRRGESLEYLKSEPPSPHSADITARWHNAKRGVNPPIAMRADQLLTSQVATRVPATSQAGRYVHEMAEMMLAAISSIFILDPVPHQMREYVPEKDSLLRRTADNLSAVLNRLKADPVTMDALLDMTQSLSEAQVSDLSSVSSDLGDVMVTVDELIGGSIRRIPARLMSDGTLRFLAVAAALLDGPPDTTMSAQPSRLLVVEELENGLHPSQASLLLERLKSGSEQRRVRTFATTHSPAILDALSGADHESVSVAARDNDGWSRVTRLVDFPDYFEVIGRRSLGESAIEDDLRPREPDESQAQDVLARIFGAVDA
ncbi:MAG: AAA family ATPase [Dermatophilaceae bacterium]